MRIERASAKTGEVFAAAKDPGIFESLQKIICVDREVFGIGERPPRLHYGVRLGQSKIEDRREHDIKAEPSCLAANKLAVLEVQRAFPCGGDRGL